MKLTVEDGAWSKIQEMLEQEPAFESRPPLREVQTVEVAEADDDEWVEVRMEVNHNGQACEPFMMEWYPDGHDEAGDFNTRVIQPDVFDSHEQRQYELFGAIVGRLTLHE